ncbi:hypothetical protein ACWD7F_15920, partial [Streptomyces sp. NPDC005122]
IHSLARFMMGDVSKLNSAMGKSPVGGMPACRAGCSDVSGFCVAFVARTENGYTSPLSFTV